MVMISRLSKHPGRLRAKAREIEAQWEALKDEAEAHWKRKAESEYSKAMTVQGLIDALSKMPADLPIQVECQGDPQYVDQISVVEGVPYGAPVVFIR